MNKEFLVFKIFSTIGGVVGVGCIAFDKTLMGVAIMFGAIFIGGLLDKDVSEISSYDTSYTTKESKPYYKNEFEEYQHYKHCKRHLKK